MDMKNSILSQVLSQEARARCNYFFLLSSIGLVFWRITASLKYQVQIKAVNMDRQKIIKNRRPILDVIIYTVNPRIRLAL